MMRTRMSAAAVACLSSLLLVACGGGGGGTEPVAGTAPGPSPSPTPAPAPSLARVTPDQEAYWAKGAGVRPNLVHLVEGLGGAGTAVALDAGEAAWLRARAAEAAAGRAVAAKAGHPVQVQAPAVQTRTVTGQYGFNFRTATLGTTREPVNLGGFTIEALAPDGAWGFTTIAASAKRADGTYAIANVPEGPHWVRLGNRYVWTDQAFVDWSLELFGRSDVSSATLPTRISLTAGNLAPWQTNDALAWVVPQHGYSLAMPLTDPGFLNAPRLGETALGSFTFELGPNGLFDGLLEAAKGDVAYINQLSTQQPVAAHGPVRALSRSLVMPALTTADGSSSSVASGFLDIAANAKLRLRWQRGAFARQADAVHPGALPTTSFLAVSSFALPPTFGTPSDAYSLLEFNTLGIADVDFGTLRYGNPFPADWNRVVDTFVSFTKNYLAPGALVSEPLQRGLSVSALIDPASRDDATMTLAPVVTPPRHPQINGKTLFANQLAVGTTPRLSWTAPEVGTSGRYFVRVLELQANGTRSRFRPVAQLTTADTAMTLPPGLLVPGQVYVFTIAALATPTPVTQPGRNGLPFAFATTMSAIVSP